jgi:hypothetical protein
MALDVGPMSREKDFKWTDNREYPSSTSPAGPGLLILHFRTFEARVPATTYSRLVVVPASHGTSVCVSGEDDCTGSDSRESEGGWLLRYRQSDGEEVAWGESRREFCICHSPI